MKNQIKRIIATSTSRLYTVSDYRRAGEDAARFLKEQNEEVKIKDGREAGEELHHLRAARAAAKTQPAQSARARLYNHLRRICQQQINSRGLSTPTGWDINQASVVDRDISSRLWLVKAEYRHEYSRQAGSWWQGAAYLCGHEDGQHFAVRVPRTTSTVLEAEEWLTPAPVRKAAEKGRLVIRQGDIYFVQMPGLKADDMAPIARTSHRFYTTPSGQKRVAHPQHGSLRLPGKAAWRAYPMSQIEGAGRRSAAD